MIYADLECLLEKIGSCQNDPEKYSTEKKDETSILDKKLSTAN